MGLRETFVGVAAFFGNEDAQNYVRVRDAEQPSVEIMKVLSQQPGMDTPENQARLQAIAGDSRFMSALDSAIKSDNSIITRLADSMQATGENGQPQDPSKLLGQLADGTKRGVMTDFLTRIGASADDQFDGTYLDRVMADAQKNDLIGLNRTAQEMGINNSTLSMGAMAQSAGINLDGEGSPLEMIGGFLRNPDKAIAGWIDNPNGPFASMDDNSKNFIASVVKMLAGFANIYMPGNGIIDPYVDFAKKYGGEMVNHGAAIRASADAAPQGTATASADGRDITVAESIRPARGGAFMSAALGETTPATEPDAGVKPEQTVARVERAVQGMSMGGATI